MVITHVEHLDPAEMLKVLTEELAKCPPREPDKRSTEEIEYEMRLEQRAEEIDYDRRHGFI